MGDFNGDEIVDLAVGAPGEGRFAGAVYVIHGSALGLTTAGNQVWTHDNPDIAGVPEAGDKFGQSFAAGDFGKTTHMDLAIGVPGEDIGTGSSAGAVNILYGSVNGLSAAGNQLWSQNTPEVAGSAERHDQFGAKVSSGSGAEGVVVE